MLLDLIPDTVCQGEFAFEGRESSNWKGLMVALDAINDRFGRGTIHVGSAGTGEARPDWSMRQERLSPQYTTKWSDLPVAWA